MSDDDLDLSLLPAGLRHLAPLISRYSEADDVARADLLAAESPDELKELAEAPTAHWQAALEAQSELESR